MSYCNLPNIFSYLLPNFKFILSIKEWFIFFANWFHFFLILSKSFLFTKGLYFSFELFVAKIFQVFFFLTSSFSISNVIASKRLLYFNIFKVFILFCCFYVLAFALKYLQSIKQRPTFFFFFFVKCWTNFWFHVLNASFFVPAKYKAKTYLIFFFFCQMLDKFLVPCIECFFLCWFLNDAFIINGPYVFPHCCACPFGSSTKLF